MKEYIATRMVKMEDLNHHRNLYAGRAIEWMVEAGYMAGALETRNKDGILFKNCHKFDFIQSVLPGEVISFRSMVVRTGRSSLTIRVGVYNEETEAMVAEGYVTFVTTDPATGQKTSHGVTMDGIAGAREHEWRREAESYFA